MNNAIFYENLREIKFQSRIMFMKTKVNMLILFFLITMINFSAEKVFCFQANLSSQEDNKNNKYDGKLISSVKFEGNKNFSSEELLAVFDFDDDIAGKVNELFVYSFKAGNTERFLNYELKEFLISRGYFNAEIGNPKIIENGNFIKLIIPINEGMIYRIGEVNISGNKQISSKEIRTFLEFKEGHIYNMNAVRKKAFEELPKFYGNKGFVLCDVDTDNVIERGNPKNPDERIFDFDIIVEEGKVFRVGQINILGTADKKAVRALLKINAGEIFNQSKIEDSLKKLKETDLFEEIDFNKDVEIRVEKEKTDDNKNFKFAESKTAIKYKISSQNDTETEVQKDDTVSINIIVNRRKPTKNYYLGVIKFIGNKTVSNAELNKVFEFQKNSYFDVKDFVEKVKAFNQTGKFKPIVENDIDIEIGLEGKEDDEFSEQINLTINFVELTQPQ